MRPLARRHQLHAEQLDDELVIYDQQTSHAHCLNHVAATVWQHCDGCHDESALLAVVRQEADPNADVAMIEATIELLFENDLISDVDIASSTRKSSGGMTRREMAKSTIALGALAGLVTTIDVPTPAAAQSIDINA